MFVRQSTDEEHQSSSIEAQDSGLRSYAKSHAGRSLVARFEDDASGANRPAECALGRNSVAPRAA
ncbi:recombinase family protein [Actinomycetes bacterium KLBMP 9797]